MASRTVDSVPTRPQSKPIRYSVSDAAMLWAVSRKVPLSLILERITTPAISNAVKKYINPANRAEELCEPPAIRPVIIVSPMSYLIDDSLGIERRAEIGGITRF